MTSPSTIHSVPIVGLRKPRTSCIFCLQPKIAYFYSDKNLSYYSSMGLKIIPLKIWGLIGPHLAIFQTFVKSSGITEGVPVGCGSHIQLYQLFVFSRLFTLNLHRTWYWQALLLHSLLPPSFYLSHPLSWTHSYCQKGSKAYRERAAKRSPSYSELRMVVVTFIANKVGSSLNLVLL